VSTIRSGRESLYYPFHLCHEQTLNRLLTEYGAVHFRDYMAMQLTPTTGTTAYTDRMGQFHEALVQEGRIVQGYSVSGPLDADMVQSVDRDLADPQWRLLFHDAIRSDRRFQRGLFDLSHGVRVGSTLVPGPAALLELSQPSRAEQRYSTRRVRDLSLQPSSLAVSYDFEYGLALVKTSAALVYTVRLCQTHRLEGVTDSQPHFHLLERTRNRDRLEIQHHYVKQHKENESAGRA
jgi:hypothetical protein